MVVIKIIVRFSRCFKWIFFMPTWNIIYTARSSGSIWISWVMNITRGVIHKIRIPIGKGYRFWINNGVFINKSVCKSKKYQCKNASNPGIAIKDGIKNTTQKVGYSTTYQCRENYSHSTLIPGKCWLSRYVVFHRAIQIFGTCMRSIISNRPLFIHHNSIKGQFYA